MTAFYVGQRVRIIHSDTPKLIGREATIIGPLTSFVSDYNDQEFFGHELCVDGIGIADFDGIGWAIAPEFLEPILPEGWQLTEWDKCLWQPEGEIA